MRPALIALLLMIFVSLAALAFVVLISPVGAQPVETLTYFFGDTWTLNEDAGTRHTGGNAQPVSHRPRRS
jgi:hypothetical protein